MTEENLNQEQEDKSKPDDGSESEDSELEELFKDSEIPEGETPDEKVVRLEKEMSDVKKGVSKFFSQKGREKKEVKEKEPEKKEATKPYDDDIMEEVALSKYPEAEHVLDQAKDIAAKTGRSLLKVLREESWLLEKAKSLSEANKAKGKIQSPSNQIEGEIDFSKIGKMTDEEQGNAILKMSDKDYKKWQDYQRKHSSTPGKITL